jgi:hypothetical protein
MVNDDLERMTAHELSAEGARVRQRIEEIDLGKVVTAMPSDLLRLHERETRIAYELEKRSSADR